MPGSGLGLAIVKQVVLKHGGALRVEDAVPGGQPPGTAIHVVLPGRPMPGESARHADSGVRLARESAPTMMSLGALGEASLSTCPEAFSKCDSQPA